MKFRLPFLATGFTSALFLPALFLPALFVQSLAGQTPGVEKIASPAGAGANQANWSVAADGSPLLSWVEGDSLRYSIRRAGAWTPARTVAAHRPFFHHPAELPEVIALGGGALAAHWIESPGEGSDAEYAYVSASPDGAKWSTPVMAHQNRSPVEHGLASMVASGANEASLIWLEALKGEDGPVSLKRTVVSGAGAVLKEETLDADVCACCPTAVVKTAHGLMVAYRDHTAGDIRDIAAIRFEGGKWSGSKIVFPDRWQINACPVNAAAAGAKGDNVAVAWYTASGDKPRVEAAFSTDGGATFGKAVVASTGEAYGYASVAMDDAGGGALVSWLERGGGAARVLLRHVAANGTLGPVGEVAKGERAALGYPRLVRVAGETLIVSGSVQVARIR